MVLPVGAIIALVAVLVVCMVGFGAFFLPCGKTRLKPHRFVGCRCERCGEIRDEGHEWNDGLCRICGTDRDELEVEPGDG